MTDRNDECPCGSGKKYKNCCGKLEEERYANLKNIRDNIDFLSGRSKLPDKKLLTFNGNRNIIKQGYDKFRYNTNRSEIFKFITGEIEPHEGLYRGDNKERKIRALIKDVINSQAFQNLTELCYIKHFRDISDVCGIYDQNEFDASTPDKTCDVNTSQSIMGFIWYKLQLMILVDIFVDFYKINGVFIFTSGMLHDINKEYRKLVIPGWTNLDEPFYKNFLDLLQQMPDTMDKRRLVKMLCENMK